MANQDDYNSPLAGMICSGAISVDCWHLPDRRPENGGRGLGRRVVEQGQTGLTDYPRPARPSRSAPPSCQCGEW
jgi:hypothetical protein